MDLNYLRTLLKNVKDSYSDLVEWYILEMKEYGNEESYNKLVDMLKNKPDITLDELSEIATFHERPEIVIVEDEE